MRTFEILFNRVPCLTAQQNGEVTENIVPFDLVIAVDANAAIAIAAAKHAGKLAKVKGPELVVIVRPVA